MSKILLLWYICIVVYIWLNALSEFCFAEWEGHGLKNLGHALAKVFFAPFWIIGIFSAQGRKYLFNWTKGANL